MTIGILLTTSPESQNTQTVCAFARALLITGNRVTLFLMDDGIYNINRRYSDGIPGRFEGLQSEGMHISLCTQSAEKRGVQEEDCLNGIAWRSQIELSKIINESERFLTFGA